MMCVEVGDGSPRSLGTQPTRTVAGTAYFNSYCIIAIMVRSGLTWTHLGTSMRGANPGELPGMRLAVSLELVTRPDIFVFIPMRQ